MEPATRPSLQASPEPDETALLARVARGDRDAFDALYRNYWPRLQRFLGQLTHRPQMVEELINDTMLVVWQSARGFRADSRLSTWIFAIAYRKAMKALRRSERMPPPPPPEEEMATEEPEREMMRVQLRRQLDRALASLPPEQRAAVELTYYHGYACAEIAQIMECPVDTVKTRMYHARRKLRLLIDDQRDEM
jgi:RNA polymerase sigma factor (sigma-70 family)